MEVRRSGERFTTLGDGVETRHAFSFGAHYDPGNIGFGRMVALNDERLTAYAGYPDHPHRDLEIVTVVLEGALRHTSSVGSGVLGPGEVQRLRAGDGVVHAEVSDGPPTRFLQTWVRPAEPGGAPGYGRSGPVSMAGLVPLAGGDADLGLDAPARLLRGSGAAELPEAAWHHLVVLDGEVVLDDGVSRVTLAADDAARLHGGARVLGSGAYLLWSGD